MKQLPERMDYPRDSLFITTDCDCFAPEDMFSEEETQSPDSRTTTYQLTAEYNWSRSQLPCCNTGKKYTVGNAGEYCENCPLGAVMSSC